MRYLNIGSMFIRFVVKHALCVTDRCVGRRTERITTAKTALALLRRAVNKNRSTQTPGLVSQCCWPRDWWTLGLVNPWTRGPRDKWDDTTTKLSNPVSIVPKCPKDNSTPVPKCRNTSDMPKCGQYKACTGHTGTTLALLV